MERSEKPNIEEVKRIQELYIGELTRFFLPIPTPRRSSDKQCVCDRIWNTYKDEFAKSRTRELSIID